MLRWRRPSLPETLLIAGRHVPVVATRRATAWGVRLRASAVTGRIEISLPAHGGEEIGAALLKAHHDWIAAQVAKWPEPTPFAPDAIIPIGGVPTRIDWQPDHPRSPVLTASVLCVGGPLPLLSGRVQRWLKARALAQFEPATRRLADGLGRPVARGAAVVERRAAPPGVPPGVDGRRAGRADGVARRGVDGRGSL